MADLERLAEELLARNLPKPPPIATLRARVERLRRRRRRLRAGAGLGAVLVVAGLAGGVVAGRHSPTPSRMVQVVPATNPPSVCAAGGPAQPGEARVGMAVRFETLPAGFVTKATDVSGVGDLYSSQSTGPRTGSTNIFLNVQAHIGSTPPPGNPSFPTVVQGHPATVTYDLGATGISWSPQSGVYITVGAIGVPETQVLRAAKTVIFTPGVAAAPVGDVGPVLPRAAAIAQSTAGLSSVDRVETWLVTAPELNEALQQHGGPINSQLGADNHPSWVVATFFAGFVGSGHGTTAHLAINVYDAVTGDPTVTTGSAPAVVPSWVAALTDHSMRSPCPSPSATAPTSTAATAGTSGHFTAARDRVSSINTGRQPHPY